MRPDAAQQLMVFAYWLLAFSSAPVLLFLAYLVLARQWVRWLGKPATATILASSRVATLPHINTQVDLAVTPLGEPDYVRIPMRARWNEHIIHPDSLSPGSKLPVRYRLARQPIVMPDARQK